MKTKKNFLSGYLLLFFILIIFPGHADALWRPESPPSIENLRGTYIHSTNGTAWCVGNNGTVLRSTVGLNNWTQIVLDNSNFFDIKFIRVLNPQNYIQEDTQTGFIAGSGGALFRTSDGGYNWQKINLGTLSSLNSLYFALDGQIGWIAGNQGALFKTVDGGLTWNAVSTGSSVNFYGIAFSEINPSVGIIVGANGLILKTMDNGQNWMQVYAHDLYGNPIMTDINSVGFSYNQNRTSSRIWAVGNQALILYSNDDGASWSQVQAPVAVDLNQVFFNDNYIYGYAVGDSGTILIHVEGDNFWKRQSDSNALTPADLYSIALNREFNGYAAGDAGVILYTYDGGANHHAVQSYCTECHAGELPDIHGNGSTGMDVCARCHANLNITLDSPECGSCHGTQLPEQHLNMDNMHNSTSACVQCHVSDLPVNHINPDSGYPDLNSTCIRCHWTPLMDTAGPDCQSCHGSQLPPEHSGFDTAHSSSREDCASCHGTMLNEIHVNPVDYPSPDDTCVRCHNNPAINISIASADCGTCHGVQIPKEHQDITKHDSTNTYCVKCHFTDLPLNHVNSSTPYDSTCGICHGTPLMSTATSDCITCHGTQMPPEHANFTSVHTINNACTRCHGTLLPSTHQSPDYPEEDDTCFRCHKTYTDSITQWNYECSACHGTQLPPEHANANHDSSSPCTACHQADLLAVHNDNCGFCHWTGITPPAPYPSVDISPVYNGECRDCHGSQIPKEHSEQESKHQADAQYAPGIFCSDCHGQYKMDELHNKDCMSCHMEYTGQIAGWNNDCSVCHNENTGLPVHYSYEEVRNQLYAPPDDPVDGQQEGVHGFSRADVQCLTCHNPYGKPDIKADASVRDWFDGRCIVCHRLKTNMGTSDTKGCRPCHFYSNFATYDFYFNESLNNNFQGSRIWGHNILKRNNENKTLGKHKNQGGKK